MIGPDTGYSFAMVVTAKSASEPRVSAAPPTQRAYTLRLRGVESNDAAWRRAISAMHDTVEKRPSAFGYLPLTLPGQQRLMNSVRGTGANG